MRGAFLMLVLVPLAIAVLLMSIWGAAALWFRFPGPDLLRWGVSLGFLALGLATVIGLFAPGRRLVRLCLFAVATGAMILWWTSLVPPTDVIWAPELARQVTGEVEGDVLRLRDARAFEWQSPSAATEAWVEREYDLSTLATTDLFMSYWAGPAMAHMMVSFGFTDGRYLVWSIEVRRSADSAFSPIADFFRTNPIIVVAGEERDIVGLRTNIRGERVHLFRLGMPPATARRLLEEYVQFSNRLATSPKFFNSVFTNCSFTVLRLARAIGIAFPLDWRLIVNGHVPAYLYDRGVLNPSYSLETLFADGLVTPRAQAAGLTDRFSEVIREGVPPAK